MRQKAHLWKYTILQKLRFILSVKINNSCVQLRFWNLIRGRSSRGDSFRWMLLCYYYLFSIWKISCNTDDVVKVPHKWLKNSGKWPTLSLSNVISRNPICNATLNVLWNLTYRMFLSFSVNSVKPISLG